MSPRLRAIALLVLAILVVAGWRVWKVHRVGAEEMRHAAASTNSAAPVTSAAGSFVAAPPKPLETAAGERAVLAEKMKRLSAQPLRPSLCRPGVNTVAEALAQLQDMDESERAKYFQQLLLFCLEIDRPGTADLIASLEDEKSRDFGLAHALSQWADNDPAAALRWAADHPRGDNDRTRYHAAYEGFAAQHPMGERNATIGKILGCRSVGRGRKLKTERGERQAPAGSIPPESKAKSSGHVSLIMSTPSPVLLRIQS